MADLINLRQARKAIARKRHVQNAAENRLAFGQSKGAKALMHAETYLEKLKLDNLCRVKSNEP